MTPSSHPKAALNTTIGLLKIKAFHFGVRGHDRKRINGAYKTEKMKNRENEKFACKFRGAII